MSLVGSLEDLGLTDILQIVSLARKSGRLLLRSGNDAGRIVLEEGLVRAAAIKGEGEDLRALLVDPGFVSAEDFERASERADRQGQALREAVVEVSGFPAERLDSLRREHVERSVMRMFQWRNGEFSFEVRDDVDPEDLGLLLPNGISTQYLAMEATRLRDEGGTPEPPAAADDDMPVFSGESTGSGTVGAAGVGPGAIDTIALAASRNFSGLEEEPAEPLDDRPADPEPAAIRVEALDPSRPVDVVVEVARAARPVVAMDVNLTALEWLKASVGPAAARVHIFQRVDLAVERIRQYLARGVVPLVVAGPTLLARSADPSLLPRLRGVAPGIQVLALLEHGRHQGGVPRGYDGIAERPAALPLDAELWSGHEPLARVLRETLTRFSEVVTVRPSPSFRASLDRLRDVSDRMRDPSGRVDVLSLVLEFAAEQFSRVAVFMIRDELAVGMAQRGFPTGPGRPDLVQRQLDTRKLPELFGAALGSRRGVCGRLSEAEHAKASWLGEAPPAAAYVGPIESSGCVVALLYADHLPERRPVGDTAALEVVLHEAGLALDRAVLERALADADGTP